MSRIPLTRINDWFDAMAALFGDNTEQSLAGRAYREGLISAAEYHDLTGVTVFAARICKPEDNPLRSISEVSDADMV